MKKTAAALSIVLLASACAEQQSQPLDQVTLEQPTTAQPPERRGTDASQQSAAESTALYKSNGPAATSGQALYDSAHRNLQPSLATPQRGQKEVQFSPVMHATDRENYLSYTANGVVLTSEEPVSTFSVDVDSAGYASLRRMLLREGRLPPVDAVRTEEMINYFAYQYPAPDSVQQPFSVHTELAPAPWSQSRQLLQIGLKGYLPPASERPPANLVFLVDVSGSMQSPDKLGLLKKSLRLLVKQLNARDRIALAVYAGAAGTVLSSTPGNEKLAITSAIDALQAGGSTHGSAGIELAYALAQQNRIEDGINRVIIASDGDMNVGTVNLEALKTLVARQRASGVSLTTLGFGSGNYNYALMEQLADVGNGVAAYIDSLSEAQKVLVSELQSTLQTIASDVKIQVEFNPQRVSDYRLIGYENRMLEREDFTNDKVDAGDIGAGHTVTALYEITLAGAPEQRIPALRYGHTAAKEPSAANSEFAYVKLRYKKPGSSNSVEIARAIDASSLHGSIEEASSELRFAASVAAFGDLLRGGQNSADWNYDDVIAMAADARGNDPYGYRSEFLSLVRMARSLTPDTRTALR
tara:strand:- start:84383 stop:86131 length:1749 start_codon:yes stop_codon:yes gene_type:complete